MPDAIDLSPDSHDVPAAARSLLGCTLACRGAAVVIVETEAYHEREPSCHAHRGETPRTRPLFGEPGTCYVYFTYGMHWCFNVVTCPPGVGAAVLVRAGEPIAGLDLMRQRRQRPSARPLRDHDLCSGPAKLVQALDIRADDMGSAVTSDATTLDQLLAEAQDGPRIARLPAATPSPDPTTPTVRVGPRIGISVATDLPWRFGYDSPHLSRPFSQ